MCDWAVSCMKLLIIPHGIEIVIFKKKSIGIDSFKSAIAELKHRNYDGIRCQFIG